MNTERLTRLAADGDMEAMGELIRQLERSSDADALRRMAWVMIGGGYRVEVARWQDERGEQPGCWITYSDPAHLLGHVHAGRIILRSPLHVPLLWDDRRARLFACDCAERVLPIIESYDPDLTGSREAIEMVRSVVHHSGGVDHRRLSLAWEAAHGVRRVLSYRRGTQAQVYAARSCMAAANDGHRDLSRGTAQWEATAASRLALQATDAKAGVDAAARGCAGHVVMIVRDREREAEREWQRRRLLAYMLGCEDLHLAGEPR